MTFSAVTEAPRPRSAGRQITKALVACAALLSVLVVATPSEAAPASVSAEEFAKKCDDTGEVRVATALEVVGGYGHLDRGCSVLLAPGAEVTFAGVHLSGFSLVSQGGEHTTVKVTGSSFIMEESLELTAGCCSGEPWEKGGTVYIDNSYLEGSAVYVWASIGADNGGVFIQDSKLAATGPRPNIRMEASARAASNGYAYVANSAFITRRTTSVTSGRYGTTVFKGNDVDRATGLIEVQTGAGGSCASYGNTRTVTCR